MDTKGVEDVIDVIVTEDVIHVIINPTISLIEEQCLYTLMARLFMVRFYSAVGFFVYLFCFGFGFLFVLVCLFCFVFHKTG